MRVQTRFAKKQQLDLFEDDEIPQRPLIVESAAKYDDSTARFFIDHSKAFLRSFFRAENAIPKSVRSPKYRMMMPDFLNYALRREFGPEIFGDVEHKGKSHDWELRGSRISVKSVHHDIFPYTENNKAYGPRSIQLKNTRGKRIIENVFDYLLVTVHSERSFGMYLWGYPQVKELLKNSSCFADCDEHGFDGSGQILFFPHRKDDCLAVLELNDALLNEFSSKYAKKSIDEADKDAKWIMGQQKCIEDQFIMSEGGM